MNTKDLNITTEKAKGNIWLKGLFGLEKENLRVNKDGTLALTPHPEVFENKLNHPYITTDFSESQIEMITPPLPEVQKSLQFLSNVQGIVENELKSEYLWPQSLAPILPDEEDIPIARYNANGIEQHQYREILAKKYGKKKQMFSGIHFNFSFDEQLLKKLYQEQNSTIDYEKFRENAYLKTVQQLLKNRWIYILLFGYSPVNHEENHLDCPQSGTSVNEFENRISIRNSCFGYTNIEELFPDYSSIDNYLKSIDKMISSGILSSAKELYSPVRIKFEPGSKRISYIELRFIDIDPTIKEGISKEQLHFLHWLSIYALLNNKDENLNIELQKIANKNHNIAALNGLLHDLSIYNNSFQKIDAWKEAKKILKEIKALANYRHIFDKDYQNSLENVFELVNHPQKRKIHHLIEEINHHGYVNYHLNKAVEHKETIKEEDYKFKGYEDLELSTQLLLKEAVKRGIQFEILDRKENFIKLSKGNKIQYIQQATKTSLDNYASILAMENKVVTKHILKDNDISTPEGSQYDSEEEAMADYYIFANQSIVVKPKQTNFGKGITIFKEAFTRTDYETAIINAFKHDNSILIEQYFDGKEYRFFIIGDKVEGILHRVPANVVGDGKKSVRELIIEKNKNILRGKGYKTPLEKIDMGEKELQKLKNQGKDFESIPRKNEIVYLRNTSNISTGGDSIDFTDDIHDSYKRIAVEAAKALNVKITGLDMIIKDYLKPASPENYSIIELNFNPAIHIHCFPFQGKNRKLDAKILDALGY